MSLLTASAFPEAGACLFYPQQFHYNTSMKTALKNIDITRLHVLTDMIKDEYGGVFPTITEDNAIALYHVPSKFRELLHLGATHSYTDKRTGIKEEFKVAALPHRRAQCAFKVKCEEYIVHFCKTSLWCDGDFHSELEGHWRILPLDVYHRGVTEFIFDQFFFDRKYLREVKVLRWINGNRTGRGRNINRWQTRCNAPVISNIVGSLVEECITHLTVDDELTPGLLLGIPSTRLLVELYTALTGKEYLATLDSATRSMIVDTLMNMEGFMPYVINRVAMGLQREWRQFLEEEEQEEEYQRELDEMIQREDDDLLQRQEILRDLSPQRRSVNATRHN